MTKETVPVSFFLGADNRARYCSLFGEVYSPFDEGRHYILKGGPGTGKSTFMKKVAQKLEARGYFVERCYCSADPASLDMIYAPEINYSILDGTSPHNFDATLPGVTEFYVNLGEAWDTRYLKGHAKEIAELVNACSTEHKRSSEFLWLASRMEAQKSKLFSLEADFEKLAGYMKRLAKRKIPEKGASAPGKINKRFLSGITPDGVFVMYDTINALCEEMVTVEDKYAAAAPVIAAYLSADAVNKGYDVYECYCPLMPFSKVEHIIIPELKLCFFTENRYHPSLSDGEKTVHATRFCNKEILFSSKEKLTFLEKSQKELITEAVRRMSVAKGLHDKLEEYYIKATDFSVIDEKCEKLISEL